MKVQNKTVLEYLQAIEQNIALIEEYEGKPIDLDGVIPLQPGSLEHTWFLIGVRIANKIAIEHVNRLNWGAGDEKHHG